MTVVQALATTGLLAIAFGAPGGPVSVALSCSDAAVLAPEAGPSSDARAASTERAGSAGTLRVACASRPRQAVPLSSVVRFQSIVDFSIDDAGAAQVAWSTPIEYRVEGGALVRIQDGERAVVAPEAAALRTALNGAGRLALTIVAPKRGASTGRVTLAAELIEVDPRN